MTIFEFTRWLVSDLANLFALTLLIAPVVAALFVFGLIALVPVSALVGLAWAKYHHGTRNTQVGHDPL